MTMTLTPADLATVNYPCTLWSSTSRMLRSQLLLPKRTSVSISLHENTT